jgi:hypothetical protein
VRHLAKNETSFWRESILLHRPILPLPSHRPLSSFTAEELYQGTHQAVLREKNLSYPFVHLKSRSSIAPPYLGNVFQDKFPELDNSHTISSPILHSNGNWIFFTSSNNILRILSLRSGKLVWLQDLKESANGDPEGSHSIVAIETRGNSEVLLSVIYSLWSVSYLA